MLTDEKKHCKEDLLLRLLNCMLSKACMTGTDLHKSKTVAVVHQ